MNKNEFFAVLRAAAADLPSSDLRSWLDYYEELLSDAVEDGLTEEQAVASLGDLRELIDRIREDVPGRVPAVSADEPRAQATFREENGMHIYDVPDGVRRITLENEEDDVRLFPSEDGRCRLEIPVTEETQEHVSYSDGMLHAAVDGPSAKKSSFKLQIHWRAKDLRFSRGDAMRLYLPRGEYDALFVRTRSGDIEIPAGFSFGEIAAQTISGDMSCSSPAGRLRAETVSGDAEIFRCTPGAVEIQTSSGDISLWDLGLKEDLTVRSASGDVKLESVAARSARIKTAGGDLRADDLTVLDLAQIETASGDVSLEGFDAGEIHVSAVSGDVDMSLRRGKCYAVTTRTGDVEHPDPVPGAGVCAVTTVSGDVSISVE